MVDGFEQVANSLDKNSKKSTRTLELLRCAKEPSLLAYCNENCADHSIVSAWPCPVNERINNIIARTVQNDSRFGQVDIVALLTFYIRHLRPVSRAITRSSLEWEVWGSCAIVKSNTGLPTAGHRCNISSKEAVLAGRSDAMGPKTRSTLWRVTVSRMKEVLYDDDYLCLVALVVVLEEVAKRRFGFLLMQILQERINACTWCKILSGSFQIYVRPVKKYIGRSQTVNRKTWEKVSI